MPGKRRRSASPKTRTRPAVVQVRPDARKLEHDTTANDSYRQVVYTVPRHFQLVLMSLNKGESIPREIHPETVQFIRVESGKARITIDDKDVYEINAGDSITIPPNHYHLVENVSYRGKPLKLYTIYTPPEHAPDRHDARQP